MLLVLMRCNGHCLVAATTAVQRRSTIMEIMMGGGDYAVEYMQHATSRRVTARPKLAVHRGTQRSATAASNSKYS